MQIETNNCSGPRMIAGPDFPWVHALNERHAVELSTLTPVELKAMVGRAFYAHAVDPAAAFLLAFDQDADYDSPNFLWFKARLPRFVYIDRVAVSDDYRRKGLAKTLYGDLFAAAKTAGHNRIVCEVNSDPPNPGSDAFHAALGFTSIGTAVLPERGKSVRYLACDLREV